MRTIPVHDRVKMNLTRRIVWLSIIVLVYSAWAVTPVSAHALLLRSNPAANAVLAQSPVQVELFFSESVEEQLSTIKVFNSDGSEVDMGDVRVDPSDPKRMTVSLRSLSDGVYTVTWKAVSATDGHQTTGTFPFAVGTENTAAVQAIPQGTSSSLPISALVSKFLLLASLAVLVGKWLFTELVWKPAIKTDASEIPSEVANPSGWTTIYRIAMNGALIAIGLGILSEAGQSTGNELAWPWSLETGRVLAETHLGVIWLARLALAVLVVWLSSKDGAPGWKRWGSSAANLALLLTVSLTSHAATEAKPLLPVLDDWVHLIGMTFWFGGLAHLLIGIRQLQNADSRLRTRLTSALAVRFSLMAVVFVALIGMTGLYSAYLRVGTLSALLSTLYGHALLIKQIFVVGLLLLAASNLLIITPRLQRARVQGVADTALVTRFGKMIIGELTLAGFLLASVSFLTYLPPAKIVSPVSDVTAAAKADDLKVNINISPGHVGQNTFTLQIASNGQPLNSAKEVLLRFTPSQLNIPPSELELIAQGGGAFSAKGANLSLPSNWQVQAIIRREDKFDAYLNFNFKLQQPGSSETTTSPKQIGVLLLLIGLLGGLVGISMKTAKLLGFGVGVPLSLMLLGLGAYYLTRPIAADHQQANPIPPNSQSVAAGQAVYDIHCVPCHGQSGKGDGPLGLTLNPRPADLTLHAIPGVHTDAQLFDWITNGFPGSAMPAWKTQLSDTDRWNLVNFIRTLAPKQ